MINLKFLDGSTDSVIAQRSIIWRNESSNQYIKDAFDDEEGLNVEKHIGTLIKQKTPLVNEWNKTFISGNLNLCDEYIEIHF